MGELTKLNPELDEPINVTAFFEDRHLTRATHLIVHTLNDYMAGFSTYESSGTCFLSDGYFWISIGDITLSKHLKDSLRNKFQVGNGSLLFKSWDKMSADHPETSNLKHLHGKKPAFVGFPLPAEDDD